MAAQNSPRIVEIELQDIKLNKRSDLIKLHGQTQFHVLLISSKIIENENGLKSFEIVSLQRSSYITSLYC